MSQQEEQKEARRLWVEALRSGKYKQGKRWLCFKGNYCCLGVACHIFGIEAHRSDNGAVAYGGVREMCGAPRELMEHLGLRHPLGLFGGYLSSNMLAGLNDDGETFAEIADIIESEPPGLFVSEPA